MSIHPETITELAAHDLSLGASVVTADGERLGEICEISGTFAKIDRPLRRDIWISALHLFVDEDVVRTGFPKSDLAVYQLDGPDTKTLDDTPAARSTVLLSDEEQLKQRVQMERDLAAQRQQLAHEHPRGEDSPPDTGGTVGEPVELELARLERLGLAAENPAGRGSAAAPHLQRKGASGGASGRAHTVLWLLPVVAVAIAVSLYVGAAYRNRHR